MMKKNFGQYDLPGKDLSLNSVKAEWLRGIALPRNVTRIQHSA
jgi:hypothetical protein